MSNILKQIGSLLSEYLPLFLKGVLSTLLLAVIGTAIGLIIGVILALIRNIKVNKRDNKFLKAVKYFFKGITYGYITVFRGTPMMVQALIIYFGFKMINPTAWNSSSLGTIFLDGHLICGLFVITINTAAYMAENVRAGMNAIDPGQMEASRSLGMNYFKTMIFVILPQALKNAIPNIGNEFIVNIKDSSVLNVISVTELFLTVKIATSDNYYTVAGYLIIAAIYLSLTLISQIVLKQVEKLTDDKRKLKKLQNKALSI